LNGVLVKLVVLHPVRKFSVFMET